MRPEAFVGSLVKGIAVVRMGNGGEQFRSLLQGLAVQVHGSIFRHYPMQVCSCCYDSGSVKHCGADFALTLFCCRRHCNYGLASFGKRCTIDEIALSAHTGVEFHSYGIGIHLTCEVYGHG